MKKTNLFRSLAMIFLMVMGCVAVNASTALAPYGQFENQSWNAKYFYALNGEDGPAADWYVADFDDTAWGNIEGPISFAEQWSSYPALSFIGTVWEANNASYWVRRHFTVEDFNDYYKFLVIHDDACTAYLNGVQIYNNTSPITAPNYSTTLIKGDALKALKQGDNVLAVYVSDSGGGQALMDFGLYGYDLDDIVTRADVPVNFTNDLEHPWVVEDNTAIIRGNDQSNYYAASWLTMTYSSDKRTEFSFDWARYDYSYHEALQVYIDGVYKGYTTNSSYTNQRFYLEAGDHVIAFRDSVSYYNYSNNWAGIKNVKIKEIRPLETAVLTENSQPLSFKNESALPWVIEDGYVEHGNWCKQRVGATFSTTFNVEKTSKLSFKYKVASYNYENSYNYEYSHNFFVKINGIQITKAWNNINDTYWCLALEPGTYTVEWTDTVYTDYADWINYYTQIKDIELSNNWIDVDLATAGTLGYEVLYSGKADVLTDVEFLKIKGPLNAADWTDIKNMTNLKALDLSEAQIAEIPNNAFDGKGWINSVILPEGITRIGEYAFRGTSIRRINIPSTVTTIGQYAFISTPLQYLTFTEGSQLKNIQRFAFQKCASLQEVILPEGVETIAYAAFDLCTSMKKVVMPNTVKSLGAYAFASAYSMESIKFSDALTEIIEWVCTEGHSLKEVHLPANLVRIDHTAFYNNYNLHNIDFPSSLKEIDYEAFRYCALDSVKLPINLQWLGTDAFSNNSSLKYIEFPSYLERGSYSYRYSYYNDGNNWYTSNSNSGYRINFRSCPNIETIVMRSATPPAVDSDPFESSRAKSAITLVVPSFSVVNYKLDTYWYQFGTIVEGDDVDYWKLTSPLMLTNNRRMQGTPDVDLYYGGQLTVGGSAPFTMGQFNMYVNESNPGRLLNTCENMSADQVTTKFSVDANKWYFFTPMHDVTVADIQVSNNASYVFRYYDAQNRATNGASGSWKNVDTDKLLAGQGYIFHCNTACTITFPADADGQLQLFRTDDVSRTLAVNEATTTANRSWNYVGNPYPCYYDIYYMDFTAPITVWTGSTYKAYSVADDELVLRPMQSFFVQKPDAVDEIVFHKEGRQVTTSIAHGAAARATQKSSRYLFNIGISSNNELNESAEADVTRVVINDEASMGYEIVRDAAKFMSFETGVPQIFTLDADGNSYAINERPLENGLVRLAYYAGQDGFYTIRALRVDGEVTLYDAELNKTVDITSEGYTFQSDATSGVNNSRFTLTFKMSGATSISEELRVKSEESATAPVYNLKGQHVGLSQKGVFIQKGKKVVRK